MRMSSAFPNAGGTAEDTQGSCMMERRLQRKFEWTELPVVFAEGLLCLHGVGVQLAESVFSPPPSVGGLDLNSSGSGCARLSSGVAPPLGVVEEEVAVLIVLVRRHRRAVGAAVRRAVGDEVPGAVEEEAGPAAVRRVPPGLLDALPMTADCSRGPSAEYRRANGSWQTANIQATRASMPTSRPRPNLPWLKLPPHPIILPIEPPT